MQSSIARRLVLSSGLLAAASRRGRAEPVLRVGDQKGGAKSVMTASGVPADIEDKIERNIFAAAAPVPEALNAGAVGCGGVGDAPFAFARAAGVKAKVISATRSSGAATALLVPATSSVRSFADLKGRTIGTGNGSVGHFLVLVARRAAGLSASDINLAFLSPADAKAAFVSGAIGAWSTWGPYVYQATEQNKARILLDGQGLMIGLSYEVATERAIAEKRDLPRTFSDRLDKALQWGAALIDAYAAARASETGVPYEVARQTLLVRGFTQAPIDAAVIADQQRTVDVYFQEGVMPARDNAAAGFDASFNSYSAYNTLDSRGAGV